MQNKHRKYWIRAYIFIYVLLMGWNFPARAAEKSSRWNSVLFLEMPYLQGFQAYLFRIWQRFGNI